MGLFRRKRVVPEPGNTTAVILAGGASSRFGAPKALARLDDRPLIQWVGQGAAAVAARTIIVLGPDMDPRVYRTALGAPPLPGRKEAIDIVHDAAPHEGPVAGVRAAVPRIETPFVLLLAVDMPLVGPNVMLGLMERLVGHDAVAYHVDGWWRPFPALWRTEGLKEAVARADDEGMGSLRGLFDYVDTRPLGPEFLTLFDLEPHDLGSVNTEADLDGLGKRLLDRRQD